MNTIEQFYDTYVQSEWERLGVRHKTEFAVTLLAFAEYLPKPPAAVLDVGGGPGRYAIELARQGYGVSLLDLSANNLSWAREKALEAGVTLQSTTQGNAVDLSAFQAGSFDVVLLMGPLYHLIAEEERHTALEETSRVLKPGGVLCASFITRYAPLRDAAKRHPTWIVERADDTERLLSSGVLAQPDERFTDAYFAHPSEVLPLVEAHGYETLDLIAAEGIVAWIEEGVSATSGEVWDAWARLNYRLGKDPSVHGAASHLLYIGQKRTAVSTSS